MTTAWKPTDDAIRAALTPAARVRVPADLASAISAEISETAQRPRRVAVGPWTLTPETRRVVVLVAGLAALLLLTAALYLAGQQHRATPLPQAITTYRGNPARTGLMAGPGPAGPPVIAWDVQLKGPVTSNPAVTGGVVYVAETTGDVEARREDSGDKVWSVSVGSPAFGGVAVGDGRVFVGSDDGRLTAIDAATGTPKWQEATGGPLRSPPVDVGGNVYVGSEDGSLYAFDATTGRREWATPVGGPITRAVAFADGVIYVPVDVGGVVAVDAATGSIRWRTQLGAGSVATPAIADGVLYTSVGIDDAHQRHTLFAVAVASQTILWQYSVPSNAKLYVGAVADGFVFVPTWEDGGINEVDARTGHELWRFPTTGPNGAAPAVVGQTTYLPAGDHTVYAIDIGGKELWHVPVRGLPGALSVADGLVIVGTDLGRLIAIGGVAASSP